MVSRANLEADQKKSTLNIFGMEFGVMNSDLQGCFLSRGLLHGSYKESGYPLEV